MVTRSWALALALAVAVSGAAAADGDRTLTVRPSKTIPIESAAVYQTKGGKRQAVAELAKFDKPLVLPGDGPFDVVVKPRGGIPVRAAEKLSVKAGQAHELNIGDLLGVVEVFGDSFPRADTVVVTELKDPGPGEKGHVALQVASDYRVDMVVPPGAYAVWVVPANGAKAVRVVENVRVQAGRSVRVGD